MKKTTKFLVQAALIAALYTALTLVSAMFGLSSGVIQVRFSEALTVLPMLTPAAAPGLTLGCALSNLLTGAYPLDILFGSLATLLGAVGTHALRRRHPAIAVLPPIAANTVIIPLVLAYVYRAEGTIPFFCLTVFLGEAISAGIFGVLLFGFFRKHRKKFGL